MNRTASNNNTTNVENHDLHDFNDIKNLLKIKNSEVFNVKPLSLMPLPNEKICHSRPDVNVAESSIDRTDGSKRKNLARKRNSLPDTAWANSFFEVAGKSRRRRRSVKRRQRQRSLPNLTGESKSDIFDLAVVNIYNNQKQKQKQECNNVDKLIRSENSNLKFIAELETDPSTKDSTAKRSGYDVPSPRISSSGRGKRQKELISNILSSMERSEKTRAEVKKLNLYEKNKRRVSFT